MMSALPAPHRGTVKISNKTLLPVCPLSCALPERSTKSTTKLMKSVGSLLLSYSLLLPHLARDNQSPNFSPEVRFSPISKVTIKQPGYTYKHKTLFSRRWCPVEFSFQTWYHVCSLSICVSVCSLSLSDLPSVKWLSLFHTYLFREKNSY